MILIETLRNLGLREAVFIPIPRGEKGPRMPGWHKKTLADMESPHYRNLFLEEGNLGVLLGAPSHSLCVIDIDADEWVEPLLALNPALAETLRTRGSRGCSFWVRIDGVYPPPGKLKDSEGEDVVEWRADGQQSVIHGLHPEKMMYERIVEAAPITIPFDKIIWPKGLVLPWLKLGQSNHEGRHETWPIIENARKYVAKMPPAISGQHGHDQTFAVACVLVKGFNLSDSDVLIIIEEYNQRCEPAWSRKELEHKLNDAEKSPDDRPRGYLCLPEKSFASLHRPVIKLPGNGVSITEAAKQLFDLIAPNRTIFVRGGRVVELSRGSDGRYSLELVTPSAFRSRAEKFGDLMAWRSGKGNAPVLKSTPMPEETAKALLTAQEARDLLPSINAIINCPVLMATEDGARIIGKGYDPSGLLVTGGEMPPVVPLGEAVEAIKRLIAEFDFITPAIVPAL